MGELLVDDVGEFGLIRRIMHDFIFRPDMIVVGPGDDGAVYRTPEGYDQVISTDTMVEGIHFTKDTMGPFDVGYHLGASNFSDMAAMGAEAVGFVLSIALPGSIPLSWVESFYDGLRACCREFRVNLLGGDLTGTVTGMVPKGKSGDKERRPGGGYRLCHRHRRRFGGRALCAAPGHGRQMAVPGRKTSAAQTPDFPGHSSQGGGSPRAQ